MDTSIDQIPIAQLQDRYGLERSSVYARLSALKIKPVKIGRRSFVSEDQVKRLDEFDSYLKSGGNVADFMSNGHPIDSSESSLEVSSGHPIDSQLSNQAFLIILSDLAAALSRRPTDDLSARLHLFQDACDHGWLLPTSELAQLLQLNPKSLIHHKSYQRYGFTFTKLGRTGVESAWEVSKN